MMRKKGFTLIELLVVVAIIALLISILLPSLSRAREMAKRTACSANVKDVGTAMYIYQDNNRGVFPVAAHAPNLTNAPQTVYVGEMGGNTLRRDERSSDATDGSTRMSVTRSLWLMVRSGNVIPKNFICPSSEDTSDPTADVTTYYDFIGWGTTSYGYQIPYDDQNTSKPSADNDPRMAILADRGPWSDIGVNPAVPSNTNGPEYFTDGASPNVNALFAKLTDANCAGPNIGECREDVPPDKWKPFNSPNHGGQNQGAGQSILYPDGHAKFETKPTRGVDTDNIYTRMDPTLADSGDFGKAMWWGQAPNDNGLIYPGFQSLSANANAFTDSLIWP